MAFPDTLLSNQWGNDTDAPTFIPPSLMNARVDQWLNALATRLASVGAGFLYGEAEGTGSNSVTLASTVTNYLVPTSSVTFTLASQRRVRIKVSARFQAGAAPVDYVVYATYVAGSSATLTGATTLGQTGANQVFTTITAASGAVTSHAEHSVLLAAGTYTAFPVAVRSAGGGASDFAAFGYCAVYDAGNV